MFEVSVEETFAAGHALRNYHGKCERIHGHNYRVLVTLRGEHLDEAGLLVDFVEVKRALNAVIEAMDHQFLNEVPPFDRLNPSAENMARYICQRLETAFGPGRAFEIGEVKLWETDTSCATYRPPRTI